MPIVIAKPKKMLQKLGNLVFSLVLIIMVFFVYTIVQAKYLGSTPSIVGYQAYVVLSGSMSPAFEAGSVTLLKSINPAEIVPGDIITYKSAGSNTLVTHRVVSVNKEGSTLNFTTRGDANDVNDQLPVDESLVVGKVYIAIPYAGYVVNFARSRQGLLALVMVPALLIIIFEVCNLFGYAAEYEREKRTKQINQAMETDVQ